MENAEAGIFDENGEEEYDGQDEKYYGQEEGVNEEDEQDFEDAESPDGPIQGGMYDPQEGEPQYDAMESPNQEIAEDDSTIDEDQELKMKIVLYYHTLVS